MFDELYPGIRMAPGYISTPFPGSIMNRMEKLSKD
jgi:hypothetical protein